MTDNPATFAEARNRSPFTLAREWADMVPMPDSADDQLTNLATMRALADCLPRWAPISIHRALLAGATVDQVCAAYGATSPAYELATPSEVAQVWRGWAGQQRRLYEQTGNVGLRADEYEQVAAILDAAAVTS